MDRYAPKNSAGWERFNRILWHEESGTLHHIDPRISFAPLGAWDLEHGYELAAHYNLLENPDDWSDEFKRTGKLKRLT